jgi:phosphoribosylformylglycinamidine cyclo-ligase
LTYIKDSLFAPTPVFKILRENPALSPRELYRTLNMGHRMEVVCEPDAVGAVIAASQSFGIDAKVVGRTEAASGANRLVLHDGQAEYTYTL